MKLFRQLWLDQRGAVLSLELILLATIVVLAMIVGLATYRDTVVQEIGDTAAGLSQLNQGYSYSSFALVDAYNTVFFTTAIDGSSYLDQVDFCEPADPDPPAAAAMCITIVPTTDEEG